jgi:alpha-glucoside transport system substrate-binding protein
MVLPTLCLVLIWLVLARPLASASEADGVVRVVGSWEGPEAAAFRAVVAPFESKTGLRVEYVPTRDPLAMFEEGSAAGDPPDVVALPSPAQLTRLAQDGRLTDLDGIIDAGIYKRETAPAFVRLGTVDGRLVGAAFKGSVKGLMWFDPTVYEGVAQKTWAELQRAAGLTVQELADRRGYDVVPWCLALESAETSGWPGTDWVEDFLLRQSGPDVYDAWVDGSLAWTSPEVAWAFQSYGLVVGDAGDPAAAAERRFSQGANELLEKPPGCLFLHQGSFMPEFLDAVGGEYDFMPFPDIDPLYGGAIIGGGDLLALTADTTGGRALMRYLVSTDAQQILVDQGGAISANLSVSDYPDPLTQRMAQMLGEAEVMRFDASDAMPPEVETAFRQAVLDYTLQPDSLNQILERLDAVRTGSAQQ